MSEIDDPILRELERRLRESDPLPKLPEGLAERTVRAVSAEASENGAAGAPSATADREGFTPGAAADRENAPAQAPTARPTPRSTPRRRPLGGLLMPLMGAALAVTLLIVGATILFGDSPGELEVETTLAGTDASAAIEVREVGEGRLVSLRSDDLEILPTGEYYEVWFVGPGDTPENPNRVSAGTFHPDPQGETDVELFGAVNPAKLPMIEITAEPGDGNPAPSGDVVVSGS